MTAINVFKILKTGTVIINVLTYNGENPTILTVIPIPRMLGVAALRHVKIQKILPRAFVKLQKALGNANIQMKPNAVRFIYLSVIFD